MPVVITPSMAYLAVPSGDVLPAVPKGVTLPSAVNCRHFPESAAPLKRSRTDLLPVSALLHIMIERLLRTQCFARSLCAFIFFPSLGDRMTVDVRLAAATIHIADSLCQKILTHFQITRIRNHFRVLEVFFSWMGILNEPGVRVITLNFLPRHSFVHCIARCMRFPVENVPTNAVHHSVIRIQPKSNRIFPC